MLYPQSNQSDGTFFMSFDDWWKHFSHIFVAINFSKALEDGAKQAPGGEGWYEQIVKGRWDSDSGGNRNVS